MPMRTTHGSVIFIRPFKLGGQGEQLPAGRYLIETEEELIQGISFPAYQRVATMMHLLPNPSSPGVREVAMVDHDQLQEALAEDAARAEADNMGPPKVET